jgi:hypothetical protein
VSDAGFGSRILRLRREILLLLFGEKSLKQFVFDSFVQKQALKQAWSACLRAF